MAWLAVPTPFTCWSQYPAPVIAVSVCLCQLADPLGILALAPLFQGLPTKLFIHPLSLKHLDPMASCKFYAK